MGSSLIGRVEEHEGHIRVLKQESRRHERTCSTLTTARSLRTVLWTDLGEISNWRALVDDLRHELVYWLLDYLAELTACSIYRIPERWPVNLRWCGGGRRERRALSQEIGGFHHGELTGDHRTCVIRSTATCKTPRHVVHGR
jgi:hypothetical protein